MVWTVTFMGVNAIASLADVVRRADDPTGRMIGLAFSGVCALAAVAITVTAARRVRRLADAVTGVGEQLALPGGGVATVPSFGRLCRP